VGASTEIDKSYQLPLEESGSRGRRAETPASGTLAKLVTMKRKKRLGVGKGKHGGDFVKGVLLNGLNTIGGGEWWMGG